MNGNTQVKYYFLKSGLEDSLSVIISFCITGFVSLDCAMSVFTVYGFFVQLRLSSSLPSFVWFSVAIRLKFRDTPRKNNKVQLLKDSSMCQVKNQNALLQRPKKCHYKIPMNFNKLKSSTSHVYWKHITLLRHVLLPVT